MKRRKKSNFQVKTCLRSPEVVMTMMVEQEASVKLNCFCVCVCVLSFPHTPLTQRPRGRDLCRQIGGCGTRPDGRVSGGLILLLMVLALCNPAPIF